MSETELLVYICDYCKKESAGLIKPCYECQFYFHEECLTEKLIENNRCDGCDREIIVTNIGIFDCDLCCKKTIGTFLLILSIILTPVPFLFIFSQGITETEKYENVFRSISYGLSIGIAGFLCILWATATVAIFMTGDFHKLPILRKIDTDCNIVKSLFFSIITLISSVLILFCHLLGYLILRYIFDTNSKIEPQTFIAGLTAIIVIILIAFIVWSITFRCKNLYNESLKTKTTYNVV